MSNTALKSRLNGKLQKPSAPATALAPIESDYIALSTNALDIINETLKHQPLSPQLLDVVKAPSGGITAFSVPGLSGDEIERELTGIVVDYTTPRAYWDTPDPVEGTPPVCHSLDSIISNDGKPCSQCEYNLFGSKDGDSNAKACKESIELYLLRPGDIIPIIVRIPVSSKFIFQKYLIRLVSKMIPLCGVVTKITLEKATNKTGQPYAQYTFEAVKVLEAEETANARSFSQKFSEILNTTNTSDIPEIKEAG